MSTVPAAAASQPGWLVNLRFWLGALVVWAAFHFLVGALVRPAGLDRPIALVAASNPLGGVAVVALLILGTFLAAPIVGGDFRRPLMAVGLGAALWAAERGHTGGTIVTWLILRNETPGAPHGGPYLLLLVDYLYLAAAVLGAVVASFVATHGSEARSAIRTALGLGPSDGVRKGAAALVTSCVVAAVAMSVLVGPPTNQVLRGQVYFAVALGVYAGVYVARMVVKDAPPLWFVAIPLVLGIIGLVVAGLRPALMIPAAYQHLDTLPAWALVRPLPIEFASVGLVAALAPLKPRD